MRKLTELQYAELQELKKRCSLVLDFFEHHVGVSVDGFRSALDDAFRAQALGDLRVLWKDYKGWMRDLTAVQQKELRRILTAATEANFAAEEKKEQARIQKILDRGLIKTDKEYHLLSVLADEIYDDPARLEELNRLNRLLAQYHGT